MRTLYKQLSDEELARTVAGDDSRAGSVHDAFEEIVDRYCRILTQFAMSRTNCLQDAEDIVQETFLKAFRSIDSFDCKYTLRNWLLTIAYRLIVSSHRKKKPESLSDESENNLPAEQNDLEDNQWLWQQAKRLGGDCFTVLWLRYKHDMSISEISQIMNKSKIMVRVLLHRSRNRLAKSIQSDVDLQEELPWLFSKQLKVNSEQ